MTHRPTSEAELQATSRRMDGAPLSVGRPAADTPTLAAGGPAEWLTVSEVADRWRVSRWVVGRLCARGELVEFRVGGRTRIGAASVERYERKHTRTGRAVP